MIKLVYSVLAQAVDEGASDIHIEPHKNGTRIRYRDRRGAARPDEALPLRHEHAAIVSHIKVIGKMDIAEKRLPQEGRVRLARRGP